jgi:hypothetical protein
MAPAAGLAMRPALLGISQFDSMQQTVYLKPGTAESEYPHHAFLVTHF